MILTFTLSQLEHLLKEQKKIVTERLSGNTYLYNKESTEGHTKTLDVDKEKMLEVGMEAKYPEDFLTLKKYLKEE